MAHTSKSSTDIKNLPAKYSPTQICRGRRNHSGQVGILFKSHVEIVPFYY